MVKLIDKAIVINVKIHKNERKRLYSSNKENLTKQTAANISSIFIDIQDKNKFNNIKNKLYRNKGRMDNLSTNI
jgi:uncharacterized membrane protein affecting hemolysin expression